MLTFGQAVEQLPALKASSSAAYQVNLACERLVAMGKFRGLVDVLQLKVYEDGTVTLPGDYETMLGASFLGVVQPIRDPWYEFTARPNKTFYPDPRFYPADLGDKHITYRDTLGASDFKLAPENSDDLETEVTIKVRLTSDEGVASESIQWSGPVSNAISGGVLDQVPADEVIEFRKPRTLGYISLLALLSGSWTEVGRFGPRDTYIRLRKYSIPAAKSGEDVIVYAKKRFRPVEELSDELPIDSIYCLRMALEALSFESEGDVAKASDMWAITRRALSDALSEHRNSAVRTVPIYCRAAAGSKLRAIR